MITNPTDPSRPSGVPLAALAAALRAASLTVRDEGNRLSSSRLTSAPWWT
jgi:hypothetical protein